MEKKLSELIRIGATLRPQITCGCFFDTDHDSGQAGSCAFGAAYEAGTGKVVYPGDLTPLYWLNETFGFDKVIQRVTNPETQESDDLFYAVNILNDAYHWTREEIADWLESIGL
jgi:hypothetical protein